MSRGKTPAEGPLRWLFLDFDSYFASVEQQANPRWRGRPLMVVPLEEAEVSLAIAVSREAKRAGVRRGMRPREARRLCPDIVVTPARHDVYVQWHHRLMAEIERHVPIDLVHSIDELSARLGRGQRKPEQARLLAAGIKAGIAANVGAALTCSIGLAPSRLLAKIAAEMDKPDGLRVITPPDLPDVLLDLPLEELPGISSGISRRLARAGVRDVAGLWRLAPRQARAIWGSVAGERFIRALHGEDVDPPPPGPPKSFGHGRVLAPEHAAPEAAWPVACALLLKAAARMRRARMVAGEVILSVRWRAEEGAADADHAWKRPLALATADSFALLRALEGPWRELLRGARRRRDARLRSVHVYLARLAPERGRQLDLFASQDARWRERERLWAEIDRLNRRFGGRVVEPAALKHLDLKYLGAKIAFGRIPDAADFDGMVEG